MTVTIRRLLPAWALVSLLASGASGAPRAPQRPAPAALEPAVDRYLRPYVDLDVFQGVVLIGRGDRIVLQKGYGFANVELGVRNSPDMVFRIASLTKPFTEVLLGRLVEEGRLSLSDPLSRYLPGFPRGDSITLDMLRTHRAGIPNTNSIPYDEEAQQSNTLDSLVKRIAREPLTFAPGTSTRYSNGGYALLGAVIEKVTGEPYATAFDRIVAKPLGLGHTRHEVDQMIVPHRAYGYTVSRERRHELTVAPFQEMVTKTAGGSLVSTAKDLHRFLRAMYADNAVRADTWRSLFPPDSVFGYQGRCPGFNVYMVRDFAHDVDVVVLANNYAAGMVGTVGKDFLALARGSSVPNPRWRADVVLDSTAASRYVGTYVAPPNALPYGGGAFEVRWQHGDLVLFHDGDSQDVLVPQGGDAFLLRNMWSEMRIPTEGSKPTLHPLWFKNEPVALERASDSEPRGASQSH